MQIILALLGVVAYGFAIWIAATSIASDIQIGMVVTSFLGGTILFGLAGVLGAIRDAEQRLSGRIANLEREDDR